MRYRDVGVPWHYMGTLTQRAAARGETVGELLRDAVMHGGTHMFRWEQRRAQAFAVGSGLTYIRLGFPDGVNAGSIASPVRVRCAARGIVTESLSTTSFRNLPTVPTPGPGRPASALGVRVRTSKG